jgi:uncharacterized tellurite resistance protein B-like protein
MTRAQDFAKLGPGERRKLLQLVTSVAWSDLRITAGEIAYVHRLVSRLHLSAAEAREVEQWLKAPPPPEDVDPTTIPRSHREIFLGAVHELVEADGGASPEEKETLALLEALTR